MKAIFIHLVFEHQHIEMTSSLSFLGVMRMVAMVVDDERVACLYRVIIRQSCQVSSEKAL